MVLELNINNNTVDENLINIFIKLVSFKQLCDLDNMIITTKNKNSVYRKYFLNGDGKITIEDNLVGLENPDGKITVICVDDWLPFKFESRYFNIFSSLLFREG